MSANALSNRSFNCRVDFNEEGEPVLGVVLGFFGVSENVYDIRKPRAEDILSIAKKLGIKKSSKDFSVNRQGRKAKACPSQVEFIFENQDFTLNTQII
ncbi:hypothetical protein D3C85_631920 [compost metagenome]